MTNMALVDYSDSDEEDKPTVAQATHVDEGDTSRKRKRGPPDGETAGQATPLPPLPSSFHSLYATSVRTSTADDPDLHAGRKRQVPHVEGNWPTHVYLEWYPSRTELQVLEDVIREAEKGLKTTSSDQLGILHTLLHSELGAQLPLHVSLSAPIVLQTEQKAEFEDRLVKAVNAANVHCFETALIGIDWNDELNRLLAVSNDCVKFFGLPQLYEDLSSKAPPETTNKVAADYSSAFHISIAWQLGDVKESKERILSATTAQLGGIKIDFKQLQIKIGNSVNNVTFS